MTAKRKRPRKLDGEPPLLLLKKSSFCGFRDQFVLYPPDDDVGVHHMVLETELLLSVSAAFAGALVQLGVFG